MRLSNEILYFASMKIGFFVFGTENMVEAMDKVKEQIVSIKEGALAQPIGFMDLSIEQVKDDRK